MKEYEHEDLDNRLHMFYAEVRTKDGFFNNFVEIIINKNSYDRSCISWYMVTRDIFKVLKLHSLAVRAMIVSRGDPNPNPSTNSGAILRTKPTKFYPGFP